jgi:dihydropteroate synthase
MRRPVLILGILNVTPDSFSDGGKYLALDAALFRAETMVKEGADLLDVGGESSRPGADVVPTTEEIERTVPVIEALKKRFDIPLSIDTRKFEVAAVAVSAGATLVNDISGGEDPRLVGLLRSNPNVGLALMHMRGIPATMQNSPRYSRGVVNEVVDFLTDRVRAFTEAGIVKDRLWVDPGIGFGKTLGQNLNLLKNLEALRGIGDRILIGTSRKSFLAHLLNDPKASFEERFPGGIASNLWAVQRGADVVRVHDVAAVKHALLTWRAIEDYDEPVC